MLLKIFYHLKLARSYSVKYISTIGRQTLFVYLFHLIIVAHLFGKVVKFVTNGAGLLPNMPILRYYCMDVLFTIVVLLLSQYLYNKMQASKILSTLLLGK